MRSAWLVICYYGFHFVCLWWVRLRGFLMGEPDWGGNWVLFWWSRPFSDKSLIQFSIDGQDCVLSFLFDLKPKYRRGNESNWDLLWKDLCKHCCIQVPWLHRVSLSTHASTKDSWTLAGMSDSVTCEDIPPFSWLLVTHSFVCALQQFVSPVLWTFYNHMSLPQKLNFPGKFLPYCKM